MQTIERRFAPSTSVRITTSVRRDDGGSEETLSGYGAVFHDPKNAGTEYQLTPGLRERIHPDAFNRALREKQDVCGLFNHSADHLLARTSSGTMRLSVDKIGLRYDMVPNCKLAEGIMEAVRRGDLRGSSFSFAVKSLR